jgi:hypothetical protein
MGKCSRERMTGLTQEERISSPVNFKQGADVLRLQKQVNKQSKNIRKFMEMLYASGRIGKVKE